MATENFISWAQEPNTKKIIAVITSVRKLSTATNTPLYIASHAGEWDGSHFFEQLLTGNITVNTSSQITTHGVSKPTYGNLLIMTSSDFAEPTCTIRTDELLNADKDLVLYGRPVVAKIGGEDLDWADWHTILTGYLGSPSGTLLAFGGSKQVISVPIYGQAEKLINQQIPPNVYN